MTLMHSKFIRLSHLAAFIFGVSGAIGSNPMKPQTEDLLVIHDFAIKPMFVCFDKDDREFFPGYVNCSECEQFLVEFQIFRTR